ncbi:response regulator [Cobetia sp. L2A1]|uniref:response regulator n=1 Tax=Cobetia sp. L2A1 TaxID=2686360 RepID=UPI00131D80C2|nr:response regulator [Cobetia sp. L2A1]
MFSRRTPPVESSVVPSSGTNVGRSGSGLEKMWQRMIRLTLRPLLLAELAVALSCLVGAIVIWDSARHSAIDMALSGLRQQHALATALVSERLETQQRRLQVLARYTRRHLDFGEGTDDGPLSQFALTEQGQLFRPITRGGAALYGEFHGALTDSDREAGQRLMQMQWLLSDLYSSDPLISRLFVSLDNSMVMLYPWFNVLDAFAPGAKHMPYTGVLPATVRQLSQSSDKGAPSVVWLPPHAGPAGLTQVTALVEVTLNSGEKARVGLDLALPQMESRLVLPGHGRSESYWLVGDGLEVWAASTNTSDGQPRYLPAELARELDSGLRGASLMGTHGGQVVVWDTLSINGWRLIAKTRLDVPSEMPLAALLMGSFGALLLVFAVSMLILQWRLRRLDQRLGQPLEWLARQNERLERGEIMEEYPVLRRQWNPADDILRRHRAAVALLRRGRGHELDALPLPAFVMRHGLLAMANPAFEKMFGLVLHEALGRSVGSLLMLEPNPNVPNSRELRVHDAEGRMRRIRLELCRFNNDPAQVLGVMIDESEHDQASQQLLVARDRAREEARLKSDYLDMLHAELTPPLQGLVRKIGQLRRERQLEDAELSLLQGRLDSVAQLLDALTERDEVVRTPLEENAFSPTVTFSALLDDMQQRYHDDGSPFEWQLGPLPETLKGDVRRMAQLFEHLAEDGCRRENASHHRLLVEVVEQPHVALVSEQSLDLSSSEQTDQATQCCLRLELRAHCGLDIGRKAPSCLLMARRLIDELGGSYRQIRLGEEEALEILLPLTWPGKPTEIRILVVDDGPVNAMLARTVLGRQGLVVDTASNGEEALAARTQHFYALVFMDIFMPGMDGVSATQCWREQEAAVGSDRRSVIIALTANASETDRERFFAAGLDDYLGKPYRPQALIDKVRMWLPEVVLTPPAALTTPGSEVPPSEDMQ